MSGLVENYNIRTYSDTINMINVKLCMLFVFLLTELYQFLPLSVTWIIIKVATMSNSFNGKLCIVCFLCFIMCVGFFVGFFFFFFGILKCLTSTSLFPFHHLSCEAAHISLTSPNSQHFACVYRPPPNQKKQTHWCNVSWWISCLAWLL